MELNELLCRRCGERMFRRKGQNRCPNRFMPGHIIIALNSDLERVRRFSGKYLEQEAWKEYNFCFEASAKHGNRLLLAHANEAKAILIDIRNADQQRVRRAVSKYEPEWILFDDDIEDDDLVHPN